MILKMADPRDSKTAHPRKSTEKRRSEILNAALKCFLQKGVSETTIKQIQLESGASTGSIYHLFSGKDDIAMTLFIEGMNDYHERLVTALEKQPTGHACICAIIMAHLESIIENPARASYLSQMGMAEDLGDISDQYHALNDGFAEAVWTHLESYIDRGEMVSLPREIYYPLIIGPTVFLCRSWLRNRTSIDLMASSSDLINAAWKSLQPS